MNDLISRKWLMECVNEGWIKFDTEKDKNIYVHLVRDIAPSAQPEQRWIPCSERLPEADERVLVTTDGYDYYVWDCMPNRGDNYFWEDESGFYHDKHEVIAWMPLPEPYQGERREE